MNLLAENARIVRRWVKERDMLLRQAQRTTDDFTREMYEAEAAKLTRAIDYDNEQAARRARCTHT